MMRALEHVALAPLRSQVADPAMRRRLTPSYRLGCKRILISNDYYPALTQPNAELITGGLGSVEPDSIVGADGIRREVDTIICGTGFRVTDPPWTRGIRGLDGALPADVWRPSMSAYLGTTVAGFPNVFMITGPNTGLGHSSIVYMIESQIWYVMAALKTLDQLGLRTADVRPEIQAAYNRELQRRLAGTVPNTGGCRSWYLDQTGRNTTLWPSFTSASGLAREDSIPRTTCCAALDREPANPRARARSDSRRRAAPARAADDRCPASRA